ncbi:MAG TPA: glycosyltransferase family 87 protein [Solirubrobacterales bacterium]|nr:glycosyltransferase family 87 protein [Solirubrobacterales bacterium]
MRSVLARRFFWIGIGVWAATRALVVADVSHLQDVGNYEAWSHYLTAHGTMPSGRSWQYPPGAAFLMLVPRLGPGSYGDSFIGLMLLFDLAGLGLLALLGRRCGSYKGVWVWLLGMPLLGTFAVLRFDLVPATIAIAALVVIHRRPQWFGALAGLGAAIKVWPVVLLFGEWRRRRLLRAGLAALAALALVFLVSATAFGDSTSFLAGQTGRGLQEEAVATLPWQAKAVVTGDLPRRAIRYGAWQLSGDGPDAVAKALEWLSLAVLVAAAAWWWLRARAIRAGRNHLGDASVSRDFVFAIVLLLVVTSRVLSPQYMVWLLGLSAVVLTAGTTRLARPAWLVLGAMVLTTTLFKSPAAILVRDLLLLAAAVDASIAMGALLRARDFPPPGGVRAAPPPPPGSALPGPARGALDCPGPQSPARAGR